MLRFVPIQSTTMQRDRMRVSLTAARRRIQESLGPGVEVGEIQTGGFEVVTSDENAEDRIKEAVAETAMKEEDGHGLVIASSGAIIPEQDPMDGSMIGL
jgi:hypothetical protein